MMDYTLLSKTVSHALRHEPWVYELELDDEGWTEISTLLETLQQMRADWAELRRGDLCRMITASSKQRHEIRGNRIRALYGHSLPGKLQKIVSQPPDVLYHGTSPSAADVIIRYDGLKPMGRQYVHLSVDIDTAAQVGKRKANSPVILTVNAAAAFRDGIAFYKGNNKVWLSDQINKNYIKY